MDIFWPRNWRMVAHTSVEYPSCKVVFTSAPNFPSIQMQLYALLNTT